MLQLLSSRLLHLRDQNERGQAMVEYGLIIALVALIGVVGMVSVGGGVGGLYTVINAASACLQGPSACTP